MRESDYMIIFFFAAQALESWRVAEGPGLATTTAAAALRALGARAGAELACCAVQSAALRQANPRDSFNFDILGG